MDRRFGSLGQTRCRGDSESLGVVLDSNRRASVARGAARAGYCRQRQAGNDLRRLRFVRTDWRFTVVLVGRLAGPKSRSTFHSPWPLWSEGVRRNRDYESIITLAMRGDGDLPMSRETNTALLERIVADQREIIAENVNANVTRVPQLWALYKEVQDYYEKGMRVPDDVTLLWCDDNWGNIRRLPTAEERKRSGGAGVYYHFDYVGGPRSYKWLNTVPITKIWEQMNFAYRHGAPRIWIVNVGDLKPMEFPTEFFLNFAWDPGRWSAESLTEYTRLWAEREFGPEHAGGTPEIIAAYSKFN